MRLNVGFLILLLMGILFLVSCVPPSQQSEKSAFAGLAISKGCYDTDGDGYGKSGSLITTCSGSRTQFDCNDNDRTINPEAREICRNRKDDNCNGKTDEVGCIPLPIPVPLISGCTPRTEICDGVDNNCDGAVDEGTTCVVNCTDTDGGDNPIIGGVTTTIYPPGMLTEYPTGTRVRAPDTCLPGDVMLRERRCEPTTQTSYSGNTDAIAYVNCSTIGPGFTCLTYIDFYAIGYCGSATAIVPSCTDSDSTNWPADPNPSFMVGGTVTVVTSSNDRLTYTDTCVSDGTTDLFENLCDGTNRIQVDTSCAALGTGYHCINSAGGSYCGR